VNLLTKLKAKNLQVKYFFIDNEMGHNAANFFNRFGRRLTDEEHNKAYVDIYNAITGYNYGSDIVILDNSINKGFGSWWNYTEGYANSKVDGYGWSNYYGRWGTCDKDAKIWSGGVQILDPDRYNGCNYYSGDFGDIDYNNLNSATDYSKSVRWLAERAKSDFALNGYSHALSIEYEWNVSHSWTANYEGAITPVQGGIWNAWNQMEQIKGAVDLSALWPFASDPFDSEKHVSAYIDVDVTPGDLSYIDTLFSEPLPGPTDSFKGSPKDMTPTGHLLQMLSENFGQTGDVVLETKNIDQIYSLAISNESKKSLKVVILNKSQTLPQSVDLRIKGNTLGNFTSHKVYQFNANQIQEVTATASENVNDNSITLSSVPAMSMTIVLLENPDPDMQFQSVQGSTDGLGAGQKKWTFHLPREVSVDSLNISTNGTPVKRNYSIWFKANGVGGLGKMVLERADSTASIPRSFMVERTSRMAEEITIIWNSVIDTDNNDNSAIPPPVLNLTVQGKSLQKLIPDLSQAVWDENSGGDESLAVDSDWNTAWTSNSLAWSYLQFDLSGTSLSEKRRLTEINHLLMRWYSGENYAKAYDIQVSDVIDRRPEWYEFHTVKKVANSPKNDAYIDFDEPIRTRFLRIVFKQAPTGTGAVNFSLREVSAWGKQLASPHSLESIIPSSNASNDFVSDYNGDPQHPPTNVLDSDWSTIWKSASSSDSYLQFKLSTASELKEIKYLLINWVQWDQSHATNYDIQISNVFDRTPVDSEFYTVKQVANSSNKNSYISFEEKPIKTRFLRIVFKGGAPGGTPVSVNKVSAWGSSFESIGPLTSNWANDEGSGLAGFPASNVLDEVAGTYWKSASLAWSYLRFDVAGSDTKKKVKYLKIDWGNGYATNYDIQISDVSTGNPGPTWDQFYTVRRVANSTSKGSYIEFENPISTRFIRIVFKNANNGAEHIWVDELKAWGMPSP
jgi:hypothetical protein